MQVRSTLKLGSPANLLLGYRALWDPSHSGSTPLFAPIKQLMTETDPVIDDTPVGWSYPIVTIHDDARSLLSELFQYRVVALETESAPPTIPSGPLILDDQDTTTVVAEVSKQLGVDLSVGDHGFMLVQLRRDVSLQAHQAHRGAAFVGTFQPSDHMARELRVRIGRLHAGLLKTEEWMQGRLVAGSSEPLLDPSLDHVQQFLDFFETYGTHYVSKVDLGDVIFQVYAYGPKSYAQLKAAYENPTTKKTGIGATFFEYYTSPERADQLGFAAEIGNLQSFGSDPAFVTSVSAGDWIDHTYADGADSVFRPFQAGPGIDLDSFETVVPTGFELSPLSNFAKPDPTTTFQAVFKAAMFVKYGSAIVPNFTKPATYDYASIFQETFDGFISTIATPNIDVYKQRLQLSKVEFVAADTVKNFTVFANVLELDTTIPFQLPGDDVAIVAHVIDIPDPAAGGPTLRLTDAAFDSLSLACQEFSGTATFVNTSGDKHKVIVDGFHYELVESPVDGRYGVTVTSDVRVSPDAAMIDRVQYDVELSIDAAESTLATRSTTTADQARALIIKYLNWIGLSIPADTTDPDLQQARIRALYLARVTAKLGFEGQPVPYFTYATYQPLVESIQNVLQTVTDDIRQYQAQITARKQAELVIDVAKTLNHNIIESGQLLSGFVGAMAQQQQDMTGFYDGIITQKTQELNDQQAKVQNLTQRLRDQQANVNTAEADYRVAIEQWKDEQLAKFVFDIVLSVFEIGVTVVAPEAAGAEVTELAKMVEKLAKLLAVLKTLNQMWQESIEGPTKIGEALKALDGVGYDGAVFPTAEEWSEFGVNMDTALQQGPPLPAQTALSGAFKILVLRGQALLGAQVAMQQIAGEIYMNQRRKALAEKQQARLAALGRQLDPEHIGNLDTSKIDLLGLTGSLQLTQKQMLTMLARILTLQDEALRYEYLESPVPIDSFDLLSLKQVIVNQQSAILAGMGSIQPERVQSPCVFKVGAIPAAAMTGGNTFRFAVPLQATAFAPYDMVRVVEMVASVGAAVASTKSGKYELFTVFSGDPFQDRGADHKEVLTFNTPSRRLGYLYDIATGKVEFGGGGGPWDTNISRITPFSEWEVWFPESDVNDGLAFVADTVDLTLSFTVDAILDPGATLVVPDHMSAGFAGQRRMFPHEAPFFSDPPKDPSPQPGVAAVLAEMYQIGSVLNGWDVVFNLSEAQVNTLLADQYTNREYDPKYFWKIPTQTHYGDVDPQTKNRVVTEFGFTLGAPDISFVENNPGSTQVTMGLVDGTYGFGMQHEDSPGTFGPVTWITPPGKIPAGGSLLAAVPLSSIEGTLASHRDIVVDFKQGSFTTQNTKITSDNPQFNVALTDYLTGIAPTYTIGTVDLASHSSIAGLTPTTFKLNTYRTNSGLSILQLFIATTGGDSMSTSINLNEPIPAGYETSLMINTKLLFDDIFTNSFHAAGTPLTVGAVAPTGPSTAWSAEVTGGSFSGAVLPFDNVQVANNTVTISMAGMTFTRTTSGGLSASFDQKFTQAYIYTTCAPIMCNGSSCTPSPGSVPIEVTISFPMPIAVVGTGQNQSVQIDAAAASIAINPTIDGTGPCGKNPATLQAEMAQQMNAHLPGPLAAAVNVGFATVSIFALENLLFPGANCFEMQSANAPGDLVLFGQINVPQSSTLSEQVARTAPDRANIPRPETRVDQVHIPLDIKYCDV